MTFKKIKELFTKPWFKMPVLTEFGNGLYAIAYAIPFIICILLLITGNIEVGKFGDNKQYKYLLACYFMGIISMSIVGFFMCHFHWLKQRCLKEHYRDNKDAVFPLCRLFPMLMVLMGVPLTVIIFYGG